MTHGAEHSRGTELTLDTCQGCPHTFSLMLICALSVDKPPKAGNPPKEPWHRRAAQRLPQQDPWHTCAGPAQRLRGRIPARTQGQRSAAPPAGIPCTHAGPAQRLPRQDPGTPQGQLAPSTARILRTQGQHSVFHGRIPGRAPRASTAPAPRQDPGTHAGPSTAPAPTAGSLARTQSQRSAFPDRIPGIPYRSQHSAFHGQQEHAQGLWSALPAHFLGGGQHQPYTWCCSAPQQAGFKSRPEED